MQSKVIQRQYDEVIASHYDFDPQSTVGDSLDRAIQQILRNEVIDDDGTPATVLDLGVGTGLFLEKLRTDANRTIEPYGIDISQKMIDIACTRLPDLVAAVDDAARLDDHFQALSFDLVCTHFITGFVGIRVLAPKIRDRLEEGGFWSFVGGTKAGFPELQKKANSLAVKLLFGGGALDVGDYVCNPSGEEEVVGVLEENGFTICECETFLPKLEFKNLDDFIEFAYRGGWLTPFIEVLGLQKASPMVRTFLNKFVFPVRDHHNIVIALARKTS